MLIRNSFKHVIRRTKTKSNSGFTLVELLISSAMGVVIIGAAGYGLMSILRNSSSATAQIQQRNDLNRALEFISDEMKRAVTIEVDPSDNLTGVDIPSNGSADDAVLALNIPGIPGNNADTPVVYFLSSPADDDIWQGPKVIYRYGPPLDADGNFTNGNWGLEPLVDGMSEEDAATNCDNGWTAVPEDPQGFYACVRPTANDAEVAEIARLFAIADSGSSGNYVQNNYQLSNQVFARAEVESLEGDNPDETYAEACDFTAMGFICPPPPPPGGTPPGGTPPGTPSLTYKIDNLGSALARNSDGDLWDMEISVYSLEDDDDNIFTPPIETLLQTKTVSGSQSVDFEVETNLPVVFKVKPDDSSTLDSDFDSSIQNRDYVVSTNTEQFKLLDADKLGDALERSYEKSDGTFQKTAKEVLRDNNLTDPKQPDKINLKDNQYVVAFEVGQANQTDPDHPGIDYNDQLLLVTVSESDSDASYE